MAKVSEVTQAMTDLFRGRGNSYALKILKSDGKKFFIPHRDEKGTDLKLTDQVIADHLSGKISIGVYPLDTDDSVYWAAVDFDGKEQGDPVKDAHQVQEAFASKLGLISWMETSQSGKGVHLWVFFHKKVPAKIVRKVLGSCIPEYATQREKITSYDRMFPAQDSTNGGYGNLCAIPLNGKILVDQGRTAFIDSDGIPFTSQSDIILQAHGQRNDIQALVEANKKIPDIRKFDIKNSPTSKQIPGGTKLLCPQGCAWLRNCQDRVETLPYPEWYAALTQFTRVEEGEILAHRFSEGHPDYVPEDTSRQFQQALKADKPLLCTTIWEKFGDCFHSTAKVLLASGETLSIGDIVRNKLDVEVMSFNILEETLEPKKILRWVQVFYKNQGWRYLSYVGAKQGPTIGRENLCKERGAFVTGNHNILTKDGYKQVDQLTSISKIQTNEIEPNSLQQQVIVGALLGDSSLQKSPSERAILKFGHMYKQTEWLKLKTDSLAGISFSERLDKAYKQTKESHRAWSKTSAYFGDLYKDWYPEHKKIVPRNIKLTPLTLATWYLDDGTLSGRRLHLYTLGFGLEDVRYLQKCLKEQQNVVARVRETTKRQSYLEISNGRGEDTHHSFDRFMEIIAAYVPESMRYKLPKFIGYDKKQTSVSNRNSKTLLDDFDLRLWKLGKAVKTSFRTPIVLKATPKRPTKMYCLEVADNHNFIVRNMVVSNCGKRCAHLGVQSPWQLAKVPLVKLDQGNKGKVYTGVQIADMSLELAKDAAEGKRTGFTWGYDTLDDATELRPGDLVIVAARRSIGKALANGEPVLTPDGWVPIEELSIGDEVIAGDGTITKVIGVFPQGERDLFEVRFSDDSCVTVDENHLWLTQTKNERTRGKKILDTGKVRTTKEILKTIYISKKNEPNHSIPVVKPVQHRTKILPIDPYTFGCWLGDGDGVGRITGMKDIFEQLSLAGANLGTEQRDKRRPNTLTYSILGLSGVLQILKLKGSTSRTKFIPDDYLYGDINQRTELLQGLLDTDGYISSFGCIQYYTTSTVLADHVTELVRSLGGLVRRTGKFGKIGNKVHNWCWILTLYIPREILPFRLLRKKVRLTLYNHNTRRFSRKLISEITPVGTGKATCIAVSHPDHLFVTKDHIVTHNTAWLVDAALNGAKNNIPQLIFSIEMSVVQIGLRMLANLSEVDHTLITTGKMNEEEWTAVLKAKEQLDSLPIFIDDSTRDLDRMLDNAGEFVYKHGKGPIWVDYLQLIRKATTESKKEAVDRALDMYKQMGKMLEVPVIPLAQMNRLEESSESDVELDQWLKDSGDIEQTADVIIYLRGERGPGTIPRKVILHKDRHREAGINFKFTLQQNIFKFKPAGNWSPQSAEDENLLFSINEVPESLGL